MRCVRQSPRVLPDPIQFPTLRDMRQKRVIYRLTKRVYVMSKPDISARHISPG